MNVVVADTAPAPIGWRDSARGILHLAWPVFIAQLAVVAFGTVDTLLVARYAALDLAALAVGSAAYITVFIGFMGVVVAAMEGAGREVVGWKEGMTIVRLALLAADHLVRVGDLVAVV